MCTAISFKTKDHYFGRTLDLEYSYNEQVVITPRNFVFKYRFEKENSNHFSIIGMATVCDNYPLYYEATNEKGLSMAGLNFPNNAVFSEYKEDGYNIAPFELIPWLLSTCENVEQAINLIGKTNIINLDFSETMPVASLHWMISDGSRSITLEATKQGQIIYQNKVGVLTNNPPFYYQKENLNNYINLTSDVPINRFSPDTELSVYSKGMGAIGLPGDLSSVSRFVRAAFFKLNSVCDGSEEESVSQFFHILGSVSHPKGAVRLEDNKYQITVYTSCCNTDKGIYYYNSYSNSCITSVNLNNENLNTSQLICYPFLKEQQINKLN